MSDPVTTVDIGRVLDGGTWSGYQKFVVALAALALIFDGVDIQVLGVAIPSLMQDWHLGREPFKWAAAIGLVGMACGSVIGGIFGDRYGRRRALIASMGILGVFTAITSHATDIETLTVLRFVASLGLGGALPNASALASEYVPRRVRPFAVTLAIVCVPLGASLTSFVAVGLLLSHTWHTLFLAGGMAAITISLVLAGLLPESPRYLARDPGRRTELVALLARIGRPVAAISTFVDPGEQAVARASVRALLTAGYRRDTLLLWAAFFSCLLAVYLTLNWLPTLLRGAGLGVATANFGLGAFNLGGVAGAIAAALLIQRFGSRRIMLSLALIAIGGAAMLSTLRLSPSGSAAQIIVLLGVTGAAINAVQASMYALAAHIYPTTVRATGVGSAATVGRCGAIASAFGGAVALNLGGSSRFFGFTAIAMIVTAGALALMKQHVAGSVARPE